MVVEIQGVLIALVIASAWSDVRTRCIPNWLTVTGAVAGLALHFRQSDFPGAFSSIAGLILGLGIFMALYLAGGMGAGDVKLFGAVGALVGPQRLLLIFVLTGLLGGIAAVVLSLSRGRLGSTVQRTGELLLDLSRARMPRTHEDPMRLPYGAVIAGGTLLSLFVIR